MTESVMFVASGVGVLAAVVALLQFGFYPAFALLLLSLIAFAKSRLFRLIESLLTSVVSVERSGEPSRREQNADKQA